MPAKAVDFESTVYTDFTTLARLDAEYKAEN